MNTGSSRLCYKVRRINQIEGKNGLVRNAAAYWGKKEGYGGFAGHNLPETPDN